MEASQRITRGQNVFGQRLTKFVQVSHDSLKVALFTKHSASISLIAKTQREFRPCRKTQREHKVKASQKIAGSQHVSSQKG